MFRCFQQRIVHLYICKLTAGLQEGRELHVMRSRGIDRVIVAHVLHKRISNVYIAGHLCSIIELY
jgi:hypothetical protein